MCCFILGRRFAKVLRVRYLAKRNFCTQISAGGFFVRTKRRRFRAMGRAQLVHRLAQSFPPPRLRRYLLAWLKIDRGGNQTWLDFIVAG